MNTIINVITNCKEDIKSYSITLNSLYELRNKIKLISVIKCKEESIKDFIKVSEIFSYRKIIFNEDNGLYNSINLALEEIDKDLPFICLHAGDLIDYQSIPFIKNLLSKPMRPKSLYLFNTYFFNLNDQNFDKLIRPIKSSPKIKNLIKREPSNSILRKIFLFFYYNIHQSIIYSPEMNNLRFEENVGLAADILYNHKAYKRSHKIIRINKPLSIFNRNGVSSLAKSKEKLFSRINIILKYPYIIFDQRFLKGLIFIFIKLFIGK